MATRRVIGAVLPNFLSTFVSRYRDLDGYWMFGFVISTLHSWSIDLLAPAAAGTTPAHRLEADAVRLFGEQMHKAGLSGTVIRSARLVLTRSEPATRDVNGVLRDGWGLAVEVYADLDTGRVRHSRTTIFVAPHNPDLEHKSGRATATR